MVSHTWHQPSPAAAVTATVVLQACFAQQPCSSRLAQRGLAALLGLESAVRLQPAITLLHMGTPFAEVRLVDWLTDWLACWLGGSAS
jgi:hypothetical protein